MNRIICTCFFVGTFLFFSAIAVTPVAAHGTDYRLLDEKSAVVVEFIYSDNQPMAYAEVLVYSPENDSVEYQNGRTDMNGRFAFYPQSPGNWRIQADDGTGHLERVSIEIGTGENGGTRLRTLSDSSASYGHDHHHHGLPRTWGIVFGISLIANIFMGFYLFKGRKS